MYIDYRRSNGKTLSIIMFKDEEDRDACFDRLQEIVNVFKESGKENLADGFQRITDTIKSRCDDKYPTKDSKYSSMLFDDQMAVFAMGLWWFGYIVETKTLNECIDIKKKYLDVLEKLSKEK